MLLTTPNYLPGHKLNSIVKKVLYIGRLETRKSPDLLAHVIPEVIKEYPDVNFVFIGLDTNDGPRETSMQEYCQTLIGPDFAGKVSFLGKQPHQTVLKYLSECDIFVLPSRFKSFGIAYVEAMLNCL